MEWQGNPSTPKTYWDFEGMTEEWFCGACKEGVWVQFGESKVTGFLQVTVPTKEIYKWSEVPPLSGGDR